MENSQNSQDKQLDNLLDLLAGEQPEGTPPAELSQEDRALYEELLKIRAVAAEAGGWEEVDTEAALKDFAARTGITLPASKEVAIKRNRLWYAAAIVLPLAIGITGWWYFTQGPHPARQSSPDLSTRLKVTETVLSFNDGNNITISSQDRITGTDGTILIKDSTDSWHYQVNNNQNGKSFFHTIAIPPNKTFRLTLADGTRIIMNAGAKLHYPSTFSPGEERQVRLSGEAFFDVATDATQPFMVEAGKQVIRVLGTSFNVNTYGQNIRTTVVNGRILVQGADSHSTGHLLSQGQQSEYDQQTGVVNIVNCDPSYALAWQKGNIAFNDADFREVMEQLEQLYDYKINITTSKYDHLHYNVAPIPRPQNITTMLELITHSTSMPVHFNIDTVKRNIKILE